MYSKEYGKGNILPFKTFKGGYFHGFWGTCLHLNPAMFSNLTIHVAKIESNNHDVKFIPKVSMIRFFKIYPITNDNLWIWISFMNYIDLSRRKY